MLLGAHQSIAGGLHKAFERAASDGCESMQIFTRSGRAWLSKPLERNEITEFHAARKQAKVPVLAHGSYLVNLASADPVIRGKSLTCFLDEYRRTEALGCEGLVFHPGSNADTEQGLSRVAAAMREVLDATPGFRARLLVEITAGQGACLGHRFEHLAELLQRVGSKRAGVCLDSCHLYAAGYDIKSRRGYEAVMSELDQLIGAKQVRAFHLNDCVKPLGSRVDRHAEVGSGTLGLATFRRLVNDERFHGVPAVLETPNPEHYKRHVALLRGLSGKVR